MGGRYKTSNSFSQLLEDIIYFIKEMIIAAIFFTISSGTLNFE